MKSTIVFCVGEGVIKCLRAGNAPKKLVTAVDVLPIDQQGDAQISARLALWVKENHIKFTDSQVIVLIPRARGLLRYMTLPTHNDNEVRGMIDLQVANYIPFSREEVEIDFQILEKTPEGYSRVMVVIVPQETAMRHWKIFEDAHIPVTCMTVSSEGLWMLAQQQPNIPNQLFGIIDLDVHSSEICICQKELWLASREIPVGLKNLQQDGSKEFLKQCRMTQESMAKEKIVQNIRVLYVVTTAGQVANLTDELSVALNCVVKEINVLTGLPLAKNIVWSKHVMEEAVSMASLVGAALSPQAPRLNLIPQAVRQGKQASALRKGMIMCGIWIGAAILVLGLILAMNFYKRHLQLSHLEEKLASSKVEAVPVEKKLKRVRAAEEILRRRLIFSDWMAEISRLLPSRMSLLNLTITNSNILSLEGITPAAGDVDQLQQQMSTHPMFTDVKMEYVNKRVTQEGEVNYFKITGIIQPVRGADEETQ